MERNEIFDKLTEVFRTVFDDSSITINENTTANDIEDWDSLEHINLIVGVEKKFGVKFNITEVGGLKNVGEMVDLISTKI